jgi:hypothetical protein
MPAAFLTNAAGNGYGGMRSGAAPELIHNFGSDPKKAKKNGTQGYW